MTDLLAGIVRRPLDRSQPRPPDATVPCGSCRRCCQKNSTVMLLPQEGDDVQSYQHEIVDLPGAGRGAILKRKDNGDCIYLGEHGCTIHDRAPVICRVFDCRNAYLNFVAEHPRAERRKLIKLGYVDPEIFDQGKALLAREAGAS
jgi:uncharacterized protein